jgi:TolA-binding protein
MLDKCPKCGYKLEKSYNFCPNCSFNLSEVSAGENSKPAALIKCGNCGTENALGSKNCSECGAPLKGETIRKDKITDTPLNGVSGLPGRDKNIKSAGKAGSDTEQAGRAPGGNKSPQNSAHKKNAFNNSNIITIFGIGLLLVFAILYFSGTFDHRAVTSQDQELQQINAGPDIKRMQEIENVKQQIKDSPNKMELYLHLAQLQQDSKLLNPAVSNYKKYLDTAPEDADARVDLGICYYDLGDYDKAIEQMETALRYKPEHQKACLNLGIVNLQAGNKSKSIEWLKKAIKIDSSSEAGREANELLNSHK